MISFILEYMKIKKSKLFDYSYYLNNYPDVKKAKISPLIHFIRHGWKEGRDPSQHFNTNLYLNLYSDVADAKINPLFHYIKHGRKEHRIPCLKDSSYHQVAEKSENTLPKIPEWVITEMKAIGTSIDSSLYPTQELLSRYTHYSFPVFPYPGVIYHNILEQCTHTHYTHCFALPWLKRGGADFVALLHIDFAVKQPNSRVLLLLTEPGDSPWLSRVPAGVDIIDISKYVWEISHDALLLIIVRLLVQLKIDVLHIINSRHVWEILKRYGLTLYNRSKIFASLYCDDYDLNGLPVGYARDYLPHCYKYLTNVFTDSQAFPKLLCKTYGYPSNLFKVLNSPIEIGSFLPREQSKKYDVLWAGRLDRQKRPDVLLQIAQVLPDISFIVYGDPMLESQSDIISQLKKQKNVQMMGSFDGIEALPFHQSSVFLYTSQWDGIPTIVIAAALSSIPVVASNVGGVGEVISNERGFPINDVEDISQYVEAIKIAIYDQINAEKRAEGAREYILNQHNKEQFSQVLRNTVGYVC